MAEKRKVVKQLGPWSKFEIDVLDRLYPDGGPAAVVAELPWRSENGATLRARKRGIKRRILKSATSRASESKPKAEIAWRRAQCLRCRDAFTSEGTHNQICGPCKGDDDWRAGGALPFSSAITSGGVSGITGRRLPARRCE
jgi:hypothetical protein